MAETLGQISFDTALDTTNAGWQSNGGWELQQTVSGEVDWSEVKIGIGSRSHQLAWV